MAKKVLLDKRSNQGNGLGTGSLADYPQVPHQHGGFVTQSVVFRSPVREMPMSLFHDWTADISIRHLDIKDGQVCTQDSRVWTFIGLPLALVVLS